MDIAQLSTSMSMERIQNAVSISVMKKVMDQESQVLNLISDLDSTPKASSEPPSFNSFDVRA